MDFLRIIIASIVGTTLMTVFSYIISQIFNKLYKEPVLLDYLLQLLKIDIDPSLKRFSGWTIHYITGLIFVIIFDVLWLNVIEFSLLSTLLFGALSGIIGILCWQIMFYQINNKLKIDYLDYYVQLFFAHVIFAVGVYLVYIYY